MNHIEVPVGAQTSAQELGSQPDAALADIRQRLGALTDRRDKARAAASWLFFERGEYPSAARVREITGVGSMNDISRDLREFWGDIRQKMQVRIDLPDLPKELADTLSSAVSAIWELALRKADETLDEERARAHGEVAAARQEVVQVRALLDQASQRIEAERKAAEEAAQSLMQARSEAAALVERIEGLEGRIKADGERHAQRLQEKDAEIARMQKALEAERDAHARRLETLDGELRFAKMQIANAREAGEMFKKELDRVRNDRSIEAATLQRTASGLREELGAARLRAEELASQVSELQGQLRALRPLRKAVAASSRRQSHSPKP